MRYIGELNARVCNPLISRRYLLKPVESLCYKTSSMGDLFFDVTVRWDVTHDIWYFLYFFQFLTTYLCFLCALCFWLSPTWSCQCGSWVSHVFRLTDPVFCWMFFWVWKQSDVTRTIAIFQVELSVPIRFLLVCVQRLSHPVDDNEEEDKRDHTSRAYVEPLFAAWLLSFRMLITFGGNNCVLNVYEFADFAGMSELNMKLKLASQAVKAVWRVYLKRNGKSTHKYSLSHFLFTKNTRFHWGRGFASQSVSSFPLHCFTVSVIATWLVSAIPKPAVFTATGLAMLPVIVLWAPVV